MRSVVSPRSSAPSATAEDKERLLFDRLGALPGAVVAFSGGVDSSYLLYAAKTALGARVRAVTAASPSVAAIQREMAGRVASMLDVPHELIESRELLRAGYRENSVLRCYHCKSELYDLLASLATRAGGVVLCGTNVEDLSDYRPGMEAAKEHKVLAPLADAGLTKEEIRFLSHRAGLPTWDVPASPCLASRIPYGEEVTPEKLHRIESAEAFLRACGFPICRVRHHGGVARIELPTERLSEAVAPRTRQRLVERFREIGFDFVAIDLAGFRSGSLNRASTGDVRDSRRGLRKLS